MKKNPKDYVRLENARENEQRKVMEQIIKDGVCPFCKKNLSKYHPEPILFETECWLITKNAWPYKFTKNHLLLISKEHIENSKDLKPKAWKDLSEILKKLEAEYGMNYGTLLMRFGDMSITGASVQHLHIQLIQTDPQDSGYKLEGGLKTRIG